MTRNFPTGANRDTSHGKFAYYGFTHPAVEHSFAAYMHHNRFLRNGTVRDPDNWQKGWDRKISLESMGRHLKDLEAIHKGMRVFKERIGEAENTYYLWPHEKPEKGWREVDEEESCNAIRFNTSAYNLDVLKTRPHYKKT